MMLNILADVLLIATGQRPQPKHQNRDAQWNDRFLPRHLHDLDRTGPALNTRRDLNW